MQGIAWADEMRVGLIGQVRRVWAPRGVKVVQPLEYTYQWQYLALTVNSTLVLGLQPERRDVGAGSPKLGTARATHTGLGSRERPPWRGLCRAEGQVH